MGKRSKRQRKNGGDNKPTDIKRPAPGVRLSEPNDEETKDNLRFQDPFVEEYLFDENADDHDNWGDEDDEDGETTGKCGEIVESWNPLTGGPLEAGQELEMDPSAYKMHHAFTGEWPSLSFDFVPDELGIGRTRFPHTLTAVLGSQAATAKDNTLTVVKVSDLARLPVENDDDALGEEIDNENDDGDSDSDSDDEVDLDPTMEHYAIKHYGSVNRVRVMPQKANVVATWSDVGTVDLYDVDPVLQRFQVSMGKAAGSAAVAPIPKLPFHSYSKHSTEGYAIDWSSVKAGQMASGDCDGNIHIWQPRDQGNAYTVTPTYTANPADRAVDAVSASVEDLQWSVTEPTVLASAEGGGVVRVFDTRARGKAMLTHKIHNVDVNVLSWNALVSNLLATGSDDGVLSVWDLRHFGGSALPKPLARLSPHKTPISSVEWHPTDESMLAVTDDHGAYLYDLSVEQDDNATAELDVPPQLLFVHCGSTQFKECHWHPQIPSLLMTTALSGYSVFIPSNL